MSPWYDILYGMKENNLFKTSREEGAASNNRMNFFNIEMIDFSSRNHICKYCLYKSLHFRTEYNRGITPVIALNRS